MNKNEIRMLVGSRGPGWPVEIRESAAGWLEFADKIDRLESGLSVANREIDALRTELDTLKGAIKDATQ